MTTITGTLADMPDLMEIATLDASAMGYPIRGVNVGEGPWVTISEIPGGLGWTTRRVIPHGNEDGSVLLDCDDEMKTTTAAYVQKIIDKNPPGAERGHLISLLAKINNAKKLALNEIAEVGGVT